MSSRNPLVKKPYKTKDGVTLEMSLCCCIYKGQGRGKRSSGSSGSNDNGNPIILPVQRKSCNTGQ